MDNKSDYQLLNMQDTIESNRQDSDEKIKNLIEYLTAMIISVMDQNKISKSSLENKYSPKAQDNTTVVPAYKRAPTLDSEHYINIGGMWNIKHDIRLPKFYEILINTELKSDTALNFKNFYNHIKMCLNAVTRLQ